MTVPMGDSEPFCKMRHGAESAQGKAEQRKEAAERSPHGVQELHRAFEALQEATSGSALLHGAQSQKAPPIIAATHWEQKQRTDVPYLSLEARRDLLFRQMSEMMYRTFSLCFL